MKFTFLKLLQLNHLNIYHSDESRAEASKFVKILGSPIDLPQAIKITKI